MSRKTIPLSVALAKMSEMEKSRLLSDGGKAVEDMISQIDGENEQWKQQLNTAIKRICRKSPALLETFGEILKNGESRGESILNMAKADIARKLRRLKARKSGKPPKSGIIANVPIFSASSAAA